MTTASHEGHPIGINYGFVWRDTFYAYQQGWDLSYATLRLGTVLKGETIRLAHAHGLRSLDFLRGVESHKYSWGATDVVDETWLLSRGPSGRLLEWKYRLARADQARDARRIGSAGPRAKSVVARAQLLP
jgi:CelD/BcsL family acetyltransferase involved in cellulose biosynthesis